MPSQSPQRAVSTSSNSLPTHGVHKMTVHDLDRMMDGDDELFALTLDELAPELAAMAASAPPLATNAMSDTKAEREHKKTAFQPNVASKTIQVPIGNSRFAPGVASVRSAGAPGCCGSYVLRGFTSTSGINACTSTRLPSRSSAKWAEMRKRTETYENSPWTPGSGLSTREARQRMLAKPVVCPQGVRRDTRFHSLYRIKGETHQEHMDMEERVRIARLRGNPNRGAEIIPGDMSLSAPNSSMPVTPCRRSEPSRLHAAVNQARASMVDASAETQPTIQRAIQSFRDTNVPKWTPLRRRDEYCRDPLDKLKAPTQTRTRRRPAAPPLETPQRPRAMDFSAIRSMVVAQEERRNYAFQVAASLVKHRALFYPKSSFMSLAFCC